MKEVIILSLVVLVVALVVGGIWLERHMRKRIDALAAENAEWWLQIIELRKQLRNYEQLSLNAGRKWHIKYDGNRIKVYAMAMAGCVEYVVKEYRYWDKDSEEYALNCAEELADKLNERIW